MTRLPRSVDELRGLRAARWTRESTAGQVDRFGPDAQREQQDRALERFQLSDTGLSWTVAHSGRTIASTVGFTEMLEAAGRAYDVLLVGYVSRFARDLRTAVNARHDLHAAGAALLFCDERVLSSDEDAWETWAREAVEAEAYSRRLGKRIREGYSAKFRRLADPAGPAPLGFRREGQARTLSIDPESMARVVALFERYATGAVSYAEAGLELGIDTGAVREILRNPVYNGWVRRHRRAANEERQPAPWRDNPPVDDELWERVQRVKVRRTRTSGPRSQSRPRPLLSGLLYCSCGTRLHSNGMGGRPPEPRLFHPGDCDQDVPRVLPSEWFEQAIGLQVATMDVSDRTIADVVAVLAADDAPRPTGTARARLERRRRELALEHAANRITDSEYLAAVDALRREPDGTEQPSRIDAASVVAQLRALPEAWANGTPEQRRALIAAIYERIVVRGKAFVAAHLTPWAENRGLALLLPAQVGMVSREGKRLAQPTSRVAIPVVGRREWRSSVRRTA